MTDERNERRQRMLEKVRKLLSMARDGRGNANEEEIAMRQANKLMAEFGIAEAECDMAAIDAGELSFGEAQCGPDGRAPEEGRVYRSVPSWTGVLGVGVARFTDSIITRQTTERGEMFVFRGEKEDILLARWIFACLLDSIFAEQKRSGWTARGDANAFRMAAPSTLQSRLKTLRAERQTIQQEAQAASGSMALVVVDRKMAIIAERFGKQKVRTTRTGYGGDSGARIAGRQAGQRINIPSGRPVGQAKTARIGSTK